MDTSKEYILMCEKAEEIQKRKPQEFDLYWDKRFKLTYWNIAIGKRAKRWLYIQDAVKQDVWLPRQDQLQEIIFKDDDYLVQIHRIADFLDACHKHSNYHHKFRTWEQLWLAFVMKEKYQKTWDGEDWINV